MASEVNEKLYAKSLKILGYKAYSEAELREKLGRYGDEMEVNQVMEKLKGLNLVNDLEFAYNFAASRVKAKFFGRFRADMDLRKRRVPKDIIDRALDQAFAEIDEAKMLEKAIAKWIKKAGAPKNLPDLKRMHNYLQRQGFPWSLIYDRLKPYQSRIGPEEQNKI